MVRLNGPRWELELGGEGYPQSLAELQNPPEVLRGIGDREVLSGPCLAVIGARRATPYGIAAAELAGRVAAECGVTVVSGGAMAATTPREWQPPAAGGRTIVVAGTAPTSPIRRLPRRSSRRRWTLAPWSRSSAGARRRAGTPSRAGTRSWLRSARCSSSPRPARCRAPCRRPTRRSSLGERSTQSRLDLLAKLLGNQPSGRRGRANHSGRGLAGACNLDGLWRRAVLLSGGEARRRPPCSRPSSHAPLGPTSSRLASTRTSSPS